MNDGMERARERRNILEELGSKIPGFSGYLERELRRDVDKIQRDWLADQVDRARFAINGKIRAWTKTGPPRILPPPAASKKHSIDWPIEFATRTTARQVSSMPSRSESLSSSRSTISISSLTDTVEYLAVQVEQLPETADEEMVSRLLDAVQGQADRSFDERATVFEDVTQRR